VDEELITAKMCELHREVIEAKLSITDKRIDNIMDELKDVKDEIRGLSNIQRNMYYAVIFVAIASVLILIGVLLGRGIDLGLLLP
jgi:predicted AAA+ superfamily ATPase